MDELKRLVQQVLEAWDAWLDSDDWSGPEYEALAEAIQRLRDNIATNP